MSNDKLKNLSDKQREKYGSSVSDAIRRAQQHIRNTEAEDLDEPEGFASGDMKRFLESPEDFKKDGGDERDEKK